MMNRSNRSTMIVQQETGALANERSPRNELQETEAVRRARRGEAQAFERLYQLHGRRIYALCLRMVANPMEAEDLTQEAFLRGFRKIRSFRGDSAFSTWLHRVAVNVVLMNLRKKKLPLVSLDDSATQDQENGRQGEELGVPDASLVGLADRVSLERAIAQLTRAHRIVFVLHDVQGYKHREIAGILDCSVGNSKALLHRARMRLRDLLREGLRDFQLAVAFAGNRTHYQPLY